MSLPKYLPLLVLALTWAWVCLHRAGERLRRIEHELGVWRVQAPTDPLLRGQVPPLSHTAAMTDEEFAQLVESWRRDAA
jgi:hypothetical protein